jgi:mannose-6-phosphate isomerase
LDVLPKYFDSDIEEIESGEKMYPLKFKPYLKFYPYGGRRFVEVLEKEGVPRDRDVAETWEISDHGEEQSIVVNGPLSGKTLRELMQQFGAELVGAEVYDRYGDYFPLLLKFLDCDKRLPAHMHPNDAHAARLGLQDKGKTEAWYIVKADPGAAAYIGNLPGLQAADFQAAIDRGDNYDGVMNRVDTTSGETFFVPAGRLHGLDGGNLAFEIQQNSQHPRLAVECAYYEDGAQEMTRYVSINHNGAERTFCCACQYFVLERWIVGQPQTFHDDAPRFNTFTLIAGAAIISGGGQEVFARKGESLLIPAGLEIEIRPQGGTNAGVVEMLRCYVPNLQRDVIEPLRQNGIETNDIAWLGSYGQGNDLLPLLGLPQDALNISAADRDAAVRRARESRDETS